MVGRNSVNAPLLISLLIRGVALVGLGFAAKAAAVGGYAPGSEEASQALSFDPFTLTTTGAASGQPGNTGPEGTADPSGMSVGAGGEVRGYPPVEIPGRYRWRSPVTPPGQPEDRPPEPPPAGTGPPGSPSDRPPW